MIIKEYKTKKLSKSGFTIVEVSILFVIFLIVAFLVAPLSLNDSMQEKNESRWRKVQGDFQNIFYSVNIQKDAPDFVFNDAFNSVMKGQIKSDTDTYRISYLNGTFPSGKYRFTDFKQTYSNAVISYKLYDTVQDGIIGVLMYDINGQSGPNVWGKDVFGFNIYDDRFEPFCKNDPIAIQKQDCSKSGGNGLCCSNYCLIGGTLN